MDTYKNMYDNQLSCFFYESAGSSAHLLCSNLVARLFVHMPMKRERLSAGSQGVSLPPDYRIVWNGLSG